MIKLNFQNRQLNLGKVISLSTVTLSALLLSIWAVFIWYDVKSAFAKEAGSHILDLSRQMRDKLDLGIRERYRDIQVFSKLDEFKNSSYDLQRQLLQGIKSNDDLYAWIGYVSVDGRVLAATDGLLEG